MEHSRSPPHTTFLIGLLLCFLIISVGSSTSTEGSEQVLDTSYPIVIGESQDDDFTQPYSKSYFGYTVALSEGKPYSDRTTDDPDGWIFIGAPKSNATSLMYSSVPPVEPGVIWRCSLGRKSDTGTDKDTCEMMNIDPANSDLQRPEAPKIESHSGAWIGASMEMNYGRFLTCGMRWHRGKKFYNGICYWFSKTKVRSNVLSNLVNTGKYDQRLTTFFRANLAEDRHFYFNNSKNEETYGHEWQLGQSGISLHLFKNKLSDELPNLLIGAPGVREWTGAVVLYTNPTTPTLEMARPNRDTNDPTFSSFLVLNRAPVPTERRKRSFWNEYFGYAVSAGRYLDKDKILYSSGAPRAHHSGEVVIFDSPPYNGPHNNNTYKRDIEPMLVIEAPINSFASYFGSVLHSVDLDGDGLDELVVGAPLYTFSITGGVKKGNKDIREATDEGQRKSEKIKRENPTSVELGDEGCVFLYRFNSSMKNLSQIQPFQFLVGSKTSQSRFGSAISSITFNLDDGTRQQYLVVGAPYEPLEEHTTATGAIYIYLFNKTLGKFPKFIQRITASSIDHSLNGFGISLSIPKDIDDNLTPDLAIGSFKSGAAVVLRTRPKIELRGWINFKSLENGENNEIINQTRRGVPKISLISCFSVREKFGLVSNTLKIWVKVKFSDSTIHFDEALVNRRPENLRNEIIYMKTVNPHTKQSCEALTVVADHPLGIGMDDSDELKEIEHPLRFLQVVKYNETLDIPLTPRKFYAHGTSGPLNASSLFGSRKPSPQISKVGAELAISPNDCRDRVCRPAITFSWTFLNEKNETIANFVLGSAKVVIMRLEISNQNETAAGPTLILEWNMNEVRESEYGGTRWLNKTCETITDSEKNAFKCGLGKYMKKGRSRIIDVRLNMDEVFVSEPKNLDLVVTGKVTFQDKHIDPTTGKGKLPIYVPSTMVVLMGSRENDSTLRTPLNYNIFKINHRFLNVGRNKPKNTSMLYSSFRQRFTIQVQGASVSRATTVFKIPVFDHSDSEQLLFVREPQINQELIQCELVSQKSGFHSIELTQNDDLSLEATGKTVNFELDLDMNDHQTSFGHAVDKYLILNPNLRRKREILNDTKEVSSDIEIAIDMKPVNQITKEKKLFPPENVLKLKCESKGNCLEVKCTITNLRANTPAHIPFEIYPVKDAIDKVLKATKKTSLFIESTGYAQIFKDGGRHEDNDVAQTIIMQIAVKEVEFWVYVAAGTGGLILLILIIIGLYKCGFFKREKRQQLNQMKAEHHRKSMAAMRASMMMQSHQRGGSMIGPVEDFESLENLTEAEHLSNPSEEPDEKEFRHSVTVKF